MQSSWRHTNFATENWATLGLRKGFVALEYGGPIFVAHLTIAQLAYRLDDTMTDDLVMYRIPH